MQLQYSAREYHITQEARFFLTEDEAVPDSAVICMNEDCNGQCYWDTENMSLVCTKCNSKYHGSDYGIEPTEVY